MGQAQKKNYWRFPDDFLGKEKIIKRCKFWKWSLNFGKVTEPPENSQFGGDKNFLGPRKKFQPKNFCYKKIFGSHKFFFDLKILFDIVSVGSEYVRAGTLLRETLTINLVVTYELLWTTHRVWVSSSRDSCGIFHRLAQQDWYKWYTFY